MAGTVQRAVLDDLAAVAGADGGAAAEALLRIQVRWRLKGCLPLLALLLSLIFSVYIGGPGAIAFRSGTAVVRVRFPAVPVTLLTLLTGMTGDQQYFRQLVLYETPNNHNAFLDTLMSARLGIAMLVMGPLILASSIAANRKLMRRLELAPTTIF